MLCGLLANHSVRAQLTDDDRARLIRGVETAVENLDPAQLPNVQDAKDRVLESVAAVRQYFEGHADPSNRDAWLRYLKLDPLVDAINERKPANQIAREATSLHNRLLGMTPGLELTALCRLRSSTVQLYDALLFGQPEKSVASIGSLLNLVAKRIATVSANPTPEEFTELSARIALVDASQLAPKVVQDFRRTFGKPNVAILVGKPLVGNAIQRDVVRTRPVNDCILGTHLTGTATLTGVVTASLVPSVGDARVQLLFNGNVVSNNRGYNKPVRLRTVGNGDVTILRSMTVNANGIEFGSADTTVLLNTKIQCIQHPLKLVRNIAWKTARRQKPQADQIATERMKVQVAREFERETGKVSPMTLNDLLDRAAPTLRRLSLSDPTQSWSSTEQAIAIDSVFRGDDQLSAVMPRPPIAESFDAAVQLHESAIENAFTTVLAGRTLDEKRLNELLEKVGLAPDEQAVDEGSTEIETDEDSEPEAFEIAFSKSRPVIFEARNQTVRLGLRGTRFAQGTRVLNSVIEITATYLPTKLDDGSIVLQRRGNVEVNFPGKKPLTFGQTARRPVIVKTFSKLFPQTVLDRALKVPTTAKIESLRGTEYRPHLVDAQNGWLSIAIR